MKTIKNASIRLLALSTLIGLTFMSLQSLQLRYIELPALQSAARTLYAKQNAQITRANKDVRQLATGIFNQAVEIAADQDQISNLQIQLMTSKSKETTAVAESVKDKKTSKDIQDEAETFILIVQETMMPRDQCVVFKKPLCNNAVETSHPAACDF